MIPNGGVMNDFRKVFPKVEVLFLGAVLGGVFPILCFLIGWWSSVSILPEGFIKYAALGGLLVGVIIDVLYLKKWIVQAYTMDLKWLMAIYLFYSVGLFGFFMGVPVFNLLLGLFAGFYMGLRMAEEKKTQAEAEFVFRKTGLFTSIVLGIACVTAIVIAANDASTAANINGMFGMKNPLSIETILILSGIGGAVLVVLEYYLTHGIAHWAYK